MSPVLTVITSLFKPVADIFKAREDRKAASTAAKAKLEQAKQEGAQEVTLKDQEIERTLVEMQSGSWKDEYVTVSIVSVFNLIIVGGLEAAYRGPEGVPVILPGIANAMAALGSIGVDFGFILEATVLAAIGLSIWRKA